MKSKAIVSIWAFNEKFKIISNTKIKKNDNQDYFAKCLQSSLNHAIAMCLFNVFSSLNYRNNTKYSYF